MQFKFNAVTVNGNDVEFTVDEHSGTNQNPSNQDELCLSITCDGATGAQGGIDCLNQRVSSVTGGNAASYRMTFESSTVGASGQLTENQIIRFSEDAVIGNVEVTRGFRSYYTTSSGYSNYITLIDIDDPSKWVTYTKVNFTYDSVNDQYVTVGDMNIFEKAPSFTTFTTSQTFCIYIQIQI